MPSKKSVSGLPYSEMDTCPNEWFFSYGGEVRLSDCGKPVKGGLVALWRWPESRKPDIGQDSPREGGCH